MRALLTSVGVLLVTGPALGGLLSRVDARPGSPELAGLGRVAISADGRYVAFCPFVKRDAGDRAALYIRDRRTGAYRPIGTGNADAVVYPDEVAMSAKATVVAFLSSAPDGGERAVAPQLYVADSEVPIATRVTVGPEHAFADGSTSDVGMSADGRVVAFTSTATNLVPGDTNGEPDVFVYDRTTAVTRRVSVDASGKQASGRSVLPAISGDGRHVAFVSYADVVGAPSPGPADVFVRDTVAGTTTCASVKPDGTPAGALPSQVAISPSGRFVAFKSGSGAIDPSQPDGGPFLWDRTTGRAAAVGMPGDVRAVLDDGRVLLNPSATSLVLYDRATRTAVPVAVSSRGHAATLPIGGGGIGRPAVTPDGRYVVFPAILRGLDASDVSSGIFVADLAPTCGNGTLDLGEECDDGNLVDGDGCESTCERTR